MSRVARLQVAGLPVIAAVLIGGVLGVQLAGGGGDFVPLRAADPCAVRAVTSVSTGLDALTERLVVLGLDGAACRLGVTREALTLQLAQPGRRADAQVDALRAGLLHAVDQMKAAGSLPPASELVGEALDVSNLNGLLKSAIRALPDSVVDSALHTDDVLRRSINNLDLRTLLGNLDNPDDLNRQIDRAVTQAVEQSLLSRLRGLI
jgi:hypothetical protein